MPMLEFFKQDEPVFRVPLKEGLTKIGRSQDSDIYLEDPRISREHGLIRYQNERWTIENCSSNGITFDDQPLPYSRFPLKPETHYQLSLLWSFRFIETDKQKPAKTLLTKNRKTQMMLISTDGTHVNLAEAFVTGLLPNGALFSRYIPESGLSIGSHPSNDLVIEHESVSQFHASIELKNNEYRLTDFNSTNGCLVDGIRVLKAPLKKNVELCFGSCKADFVFQQKEIEVKPKDQENFFGMATKNKRMKELFSLAEVVAPTDAPVFLNGETGTGKELMAKAIHELSPRFDKAFIAINCAALPKELMETELFGHEKGAFTGATDTRAGAFETANGGTIFLDEVAEMDLALQAKLLRVLESGEIKRVGSQSIQQTSVRIVSATHKNLKRMVQNGEFREDLYYRLYVVPVDIPALRDRIEDIEVLVPALLKSLRVQATITAEALAQLSRYSFPGNVRELKNIIQRAVIEARLSGRLEQKLELIAKDFSFLGDHAAELRYRSAEEQAEREDLLLALERNRYHQSKTAQQLGLAVSTLHDRLKKYEIDVKQEKAKQR